MTETNSRPTGNVSTYTYTDPNGNASEVLLVPLDQDSLGTENVYPPPTLTENNLSNWMRSGYFFMGQEALAQVPRNASDLPLDQNASEVTDIVYTEDEISVYYPITREEAVHLSWEFAVDEWSAEYVDVDIEERGLPIEDLPDEAVVIWSIDSEKYTE